MYRLKIEKHINYKYHDIERYLNKQMTSAEMHLFEKAMMDDPMLSDAVDGYREAFSGTDIKKNIAEITGQLNAAPAKVVRGSFRQWMRIAAALVVLLSTAVVLYRIFYYDTEKITQAVVHGNDKKQIPVTTAPETQVDSAAVAANEPVITTADQPKAVVIPPSKPSPPSMLQTEKVGDQNTGIEKPVAPSKLPVESSHSNVTKEPTAQESAAQIQQTEQVRLNKFAGRIVDEHNNPLPFANITEKNSGVGTYADANGNFVLLSADSVLSVQTRALGYIGGTSVLKSTGAQKIILKDEVLVANAPTQEVFYDRYKKRMEKEKSDTTDEIMAMPADGWGNYNLYVYNNMRDDENSGAVGNRNKLKSKEVQLVFDVNPDGSLSNIKVERSNCKSCNEEAIRLLKDGPKWKSKTGKKESTRFTVRF